MSLIAHFAINADDVPATRRFYEQTFGWRFTPWGPPDFYRISAGHEPGHQPGHEPGHEPGDILGALQKRRELMPGQPTIGFECTISVPSIDDTIKAVTANGGTIALPKSIISGVGALAFFRDTEGNVFGAIQFDSDLE